MCQRGHLTSFSGLWTLSWEHTSAYTHAHKIYTQNYPLHSHTLKLKNRLLITNHIDATKYYAMSNPGGHEVGKVCTQMKASDRGLPSITKVRGQVTGANTNQHAKPQRYFYGEEGLSKVGLSMLFALQIDSGGLSHRMQLSSVGELLQRSFAANIQAQFCSDGFH